MDQRNPQAAEAEPHHNRDMNESQDREGIAEGAMDDVPKVKDLLRLVEKDNTLGERSFLAHQPNDMFNLVVPGGKESARWTEGCRQSRMTRAAGPRRERAGQDRARSSRQRRRGARCFRMCSFEGTRNARFSCSCGIDRLRRASASARSCSSACSSLSESSAAFSERGICA